MTGVDYTILAVIGLSAVIGVWRGFVREALSLVVWGLAFGLAYAWASYAEVYLAGWVDDQAARLVAAFVVIFLAVHVIGFVVARLFTVLIKSVGLNNANRVAGGGFGLARGVVIIAVLVLMVGMTPATQQSLWQQSLMIGYFVQALDWLQGFYPLGLSDVLAKVTAGM